MLHVDFVKSYFSRLRMEHLASKFMLRSTQLPIRTLRMYCCFYILEQNIGTLTSSVNFIARLTISVYEIVSVGQPEP